MTFKTLDDLAKIINKVIQYRTNTLDALSVKYQKLALSQLSNLETFCQQWDNYFEDIAQTVYIRKN